jgi:hypothetical protein
MILILKIIIRLKLICVSFKGQALLLLLNKSIKRTDCPFLQYELSLNKFFKKYNFCI